MDAQGTTSGPAPNPDREIENLRVRIRHANTTVDDGPGLDLGPLSFLAWTRLSLDKEGLYGVEDESD